MRIFCSKCGTQLNVNGPSRGPCRTCKRLEKIRSTRAWVLSLYPMADPIQPQLSPDGLENRSQLNGVALGTIRRRTTVLCMLDAGEATVTGPVLAQMFAEARAINPTAHLFVHATRCKVAEGEGFTFVQINPKTREVFR